MRPWTLKKAFIVFALSFLGLGEARASILCWSDPNEIVGREITDASWTLPLTNLQVPSYWATKGARNFMVIEEFPRRGREFSFYLSKLEEPVLERADYSGKNQFLRIHSLTHCHYQTVFRLQVRGGTALLVQKTATATEGFPRDRGHSPLSEVAKHSDDPPPAYETKHAYIDLEDAQRIFSFAPTAASCSYRQRARSTALLAWVIEQGQKSRYCVRYEVIDLDTKWDAVFREMLPHLGYTSEQIDYFLWFN